MKFSIGDKVRFLNEKGEGTITKIINKSTVGVTIEDGFEIPYVVSELVHIYDGSAITVPKKEKPESLPTPISAIKAKESTEGIYIALSPEKINDIAHSDFNLWFINNTNYKILFCCSAFKRKGYVLIKNGKAKAFESKLIETISRKNLDDYSTLKIDVVFYKTKPYEHQQPVSETVKIKQIKLYKANAFVKNNFIPEAALIINVSDSSKELFFDDPKSAGINLSEVLFQKRGSTTAKISKSHSKNNPAYEQKIDLHIEELIDHYGGMSNAEIIQVQLRHFQKALDKAVNDHCRSLTVIHGVGNGRLKQEVRNILSSGKFKYHDAPYAKYGFGATEIIIS